MLNIQVLHQIPVSEHIEVFAKIKSERYLPLAFYFYKRWEGLIG
jgi:hypothetical protein